MCPACKHARYHPPSIPLPTSPPPSPSPPPPPPPTLFDRPPGCIDQLTPVQRAAIVAFWLDGQARQEIARKIPCHLHTVGHWIRAWQQRRDWSDAERSGGPRCTSEQTEQRIQDFAEEKKFTTPRDIKNELELDVSARTIRRRLDEVGLLGRVARIEHPYTDLDLRRRLAFAEGYIHWSETDWERVIFSDETHFDRFGHGRQWVQRPVGAAFDPQYFAHDTQNVESVGLWACFCAKGIGQAEIYVGEYKSEQYCSMLHANLLATARCFYPRQHWYMLHDNAPQHTSRFTSTWLHNHGVTVIDFPPYSPDLNPIENLFHTLHQRVYSHFPHTATDIEAALDAEWEHLPPSLLLTLAHSMPARLKACIENKGHKVKY